MILFLDCLALGIISFGACAIFSIIIGFFRSNNIEEQAMYAWLTACILFGLLVAVGYLVFKMGGII